MDLNFECHLIILYLGGLEQRGFARATYNCYNVGWETDAAT
jgi:hypothetical protein